MKLEVRMLNNGKSKSQENVEVGDFRGPQEGGRAGIRIVIIPKSPLPNQGFPRRQGAISPLNKIALPHFTG